MFMSAKERQRPAANVVSARPKEEFPSVKKDIISLDDEEGPPTAAGAETKAPTMFAGGPSNIGRVPMEAPVAVDVLCDVFEREVNPSAYFAPSISPGGFPKALHRSKLSFSLAARKGKKSGPSKFGQMLAEEQRKRSAADAAAASSSSSPPGAANDNVGETGISRSEIHRENLQRLAGMSSEEVEQARDDLLGTMDPSLVAMLRKRRGGPKPQARGDVQKPAAKPPSKFRSEVRPNKTAGESTPPPRPPSTSGPPPNLFPTLPPGVSDKLATIRTDEELIAATQEYLPSFEKDKLAWMEPVKDKGKGTPIFAKPPRFDLSGVRVILKGDEHLLGEGEDVRNVRVVGVQDGDEESLYHHGDDPTLPGYTVDELVHLSRSVVSGQRLTAFRALTKVLQRRRDVLEDRPTGQVVTPTKLPRSLGQVLILGLRSDVLAVMYEAIASVHAWLVPKQFLREQASNAGYKRHEAWPHIEHAQSPHCTIATRHVVDAVGEAELQRNSKDEASEETADGVLARLSEEDPVRWAIRSGMLEYFDRILASSLPSAGTEDAFLPIELARCIMDTLAYAASHSIAAAKTIWDNQKLIDTVRLVYIEGNSGAENGSGGTVIHNAIRFVRTLCQMDRSIAGDVAAPDGLSDSVKRYLLSPEMLSHFFAHDSIDGSAGTNAEWFACVMETMQLWRVCLSMGLDVPSFMAMHEPLRQLPGRAAAGEDRKVLANMVYAVCSARALAFRSKPTGKRGNSNNESAESVQVELEMYLKSALEALDASLKPNGTKVVAASLHFISTYCTCNFPPSRWSSRIVSLMFQVHKSDRLIDAVERADGAKEDRDYSIAVLHGYVRCLQSLLVYDPSAMLKSGIKMFGSAIVEILLSVLNKFAVRLDSEDMARAWRGLSPYTERARVLLIADAVDVVVRIVAEVNPEDDKQRDVFGQLFSASFAIMGNILPGDEYVFANLLSNILVWSPLLTKNSAVDAEEIKRFFASFLGDEHTQKHSISLFNTSASAPLDLCCSLVPRTMSKRQPSILPVPRHWLWLGMTMDGKASLNVLKQTVLLISQLESSGLLHSENVLKAAPLPLRLFCLVQAFLRRDGELIHEDVISENVCPLIDALLKRVSITELLEVCGEDGVKELSSALVDTFFRSSFGHSTFARVLIFLSQDKNSRSYVWRKGTKNRMMYLLEAGFERYDVGPSLFNGDDEEMYSLYCKGLVEGGLRKQRAPVFFSVIANHLAEKMKRSSDFVKGHLQGLLGESLAQEISKIDS
jgi:hypothetical protein